MENKKYVIMFDDHTYWCGYKKTDKQLRKAKIYTNEKLAIEAADKACCDMGCNYKIVEVELKIVDVFDKELI